MKKVILSAFGFILFAAVSANAQTQTTQGQTQAAPATQTPATAAQETKTSVKVEELPAAVKTALTADSGLKEWTPVAATLVKDAAGKEYYSIEMKKGEEKGAIKLDKDGNQVK
ncbi:hypothetical protein [Rufibacter immobilis]|uniref:hypothetical protein n=1 Tax=Rufibacter immobilis TaxID=1348778 RepID=UPI0035E902B6